MAEGLPPVGSRAVLTTVFDENAVSEFARLSGDTNPIHVDDDVARASGFERRVVHGALAASLISRLLGTELPGQGTIYLSQDVRFLRPIYPGDSLTASVEVTHVREDKPVVHLRTQITSEGEPAVDGTAVVLFRQPS